MASNRQQIAYLFAPFSQKIPPRTAVQNLPKTQRQSRVLASFSINPKTEAKERPYTISSSSGFAVPDQSRVISRNLPAQASIRHKTQQPLNSRIVSERGGENTDHKSLLYKRRVTSKSPTSFKERMCQSCKKLKCLCTNKEIIQLQNTDNISQNEEFEEEFKSDDDVIGEDELSEACSEFEEEEKTESLTQEFLPESPIPKLKVFQCKNEVDTKAIIQEITSRVRTVLLRKPIYSGRPSTVVFDYPGCCQLESRIDERTYIMPDDEVQAMSLSFRVGEGAHKLACFMTAFKHAGFKLTSSSANFNVSISRVPKPESLKKFNPYQKINHFPGIWQIGRKDNLWRNVLKQRRKYGKPYEICPQTYILPEDFSRFEMDREENSHLLWILKPAAWSCGRGIKVISNKTKIHKRRGYIISRYITNPHTINGYKYDLRIYISVTSFDPLRIYIYKEGLVRFATEQYSTNKKTLKKRYVHLTNFSVNKRSDKFVNPTEACQDAEGSKWSLTALRRYFNEQGIDFEAVFARIHDVVIKALISVEPDIVNNMGQATKSKNICFETFGFDIMLDQNLRPWLIEVNVLPSLSSTSPLDKRIKTSLMCDIFTMVGVVPFDREQLEKEREEMKTNRLLGFEKPAKIAHRNLSGLLSCVNLEEYDINQEDLNVLMDCEEEWDRIGNYNRIFPLKTNVDYYAQFFPITRYNNLLVWKHLKARSNILDRYCRKN